MSAVHKKSKKAVRLLIVSTARDMCEGRISFIEGAREILSLAHAIGLSDDPDIVAFVAVDSETDALPMGSVRNLWQPEALEKLQPEIERAETWARDTCLKQCQALIARLETEATDDED
jgi:hypothetical protein